MAEQRKPWRDVETLEGFATYLKHLVADFQGQQPHNPERDLEDFFWSWARAVGSGWLGGASAFAVAEGEPGWRCLAFQIHDALTGRPGFNCVWADWGTDWQEVHMQYHLAGFLGGLATSVYRERREMAAKAERGEWTGDGGTWAHLTLSGFLESWAAWLEDANSAFRAQVEPVTWRSIALQLNIARIYE
jgi:hypothetical protein